MKTAIAGKNEPSASGKRGPLKYLWLSNHGVFLMIAALIILSICYLIMGAHRIPAYNLFSAIFNAGPDNFDHLVLFEIRLPRLCGAILTGICLALSGALLQSVLRNPLAEPHILGLNAGASLAVVALGSFFGDLTQLTPLRPLIAATGGGLVFLANIFIASRGKQGITILKVTFCGIALAALASALTSAILILDEETLDTLRTWLVGDLAGIKMANLGATLGPVAVSLALTILIARPLKTLMLGDHIATGLGVDVPKTRFITVIASALLAGVSVSIAGPIGFIGLMAPAITRHLFPDHPFPLVITALAGSCLLVFADLAARTVFLPHEIPTGLAIAFFGAPVFIFMVARTIR